MHTEGRTRLVELLEADGTRPPVTTATLPWPGVAKNRQAMFLVGDHLYFFGGNDSLEQHDFSAERFQDEGWRIHLPSLGIEARSAYPHRRQTMATRVDVVDGHRVDIAKHHRDQQLLLPLSPRSGHHRVAADLIEFRHFGATEQAMKEPVVETRVALHRRGASENCRIQSHEQGPA